jgi:hypothetical protein
MEYFVYIKTWWVITDYDYIYNVIDYDCEYIASGMGDYDYDYVRLCKRLQSITITDYDYPMHDVYYIHMLMI